MRLYPTVLSIFVCSLSRLSEINAKIRNICEKNLSEAYANDTMLGDVCLTDYFSSESIFFLMKQNGMRLENKTPREITNMDRKMSSKGCSEVKQIAVSTLQEKKYLAKTAKFCKQNHMNILASLENNQSFYSIADFFVRLQR